jgi:type IV/VI secretion system ImpK/VasF family protein
MNLVEACDPLFQYVSGLCRALGKTATPRPETVRKAIKGILADIRKSCEGSQTLLRQFKEMELPLIFFTDFLITESKSRLAKIWEPLAFEQDELTGDDKFFKILDGVLAEATEDADEKLRVFHVCLGLGFTGIYAGSGEVAEPLEGIRKEVSRRVLGDGAATPSFSPAAYQHVDRSDLIEGPGMRIWTLLLILVGMIGVLVVVNFFQFKWESENMMTSVNTIIERSAPSSDKAPAAAKGESKP